MLEIYSNPTLGMSCFPLRAIGKRVIQLSPVSVCSTMYPHSYPDKFGDMKTIEDGRSKFHMRINVLQKYLI